MTDKFEIFPQNVIKDGTLIIIQKGLKLYNISDVVELLNKLSEENKKLKQVNEMLQMDFAMTERNLIEKNNQLKEQLSEAKADGKQLGISFMGYKMKLIEVLQKKYDKVKGKTLYADVYTEIAEEMGVDLE